MQEWTEDIPKEVSVVQNRIAIYGKFNFYNGKKNVCETIEEQVTGHSKLEAPYNSIRLQEFCQCSELIEHILPRVTEIAKTHL